MTVTAPTTTTTTDVTAAPGLGSMLLHGAAASVIAAAATSAVAAAGIAVGIGTDVAGAPIPVSGFATLTAIFCVVGTCSSTQESRRSCC